MSTELESENSALRARVATAENRADFWKQNAINARVQRDALMDFLHGMGENEMADAISDWAVICLAKGEPMNFVAMGAKRAMSAVLESRSHLRDVIREAVCLLRKLKGASRTGTLTAPVPLLQEVQDMINRLEAADQASDLLANTTDA